MLSNVKNIIFDLGGVMIQLDKQRSIDSFTAIGFPQAATMLDCYHPAELFEEFERGLITTAKLCDTIRSISGREISNEQIAAAYGDILVTIPIYKLRLIDSLRARGYKVYALSNINPIVMPKVRDLFKADGKSAEEYFDKMYLSFEMKSLKPDAAIFEQLIADSGVVPSESLFIDDAVANIEAGRKAGFAVYLAGAEENFSHLFE